MDINCDMGEVPEALADGSAERLMRWISSASIACGAHAGDRECMLRTMELCGQYGVSIGAHPGYPDRLSMGRREILLPPAEITETVYRQVATLLELAEKDGRSVGHVKPHGALYNRAAVDESAAAAIAEGIRRTGRDFWLVGLAGSRMLEVWKTGGWRTAAEAFADRRYEANGTLRSRQFNDALILDPLEAARQALSVACRHKVTASSGVEVPVDARTLCIHGDTPHADAVARAVREALEEAGQRVGPLH